MATKAQKVEAVPNSTGLKKESKLKWETKDRMYYLANGLSPLTLTLASKHSQRHPLMYFDEKLGYERELRYATNKVSVFVD